MNRRIPWNSGCFDEIELVYSKAAEDETAARILEELELGALAEAKAHCAMVRIQKRSCTPEQYDCLPLSVKEHLIGMLSEAGLADINAQVNNPKITMRLSPRIQQLRCCTAFTILNRLEKLDGTFDMFQPNAILELQVPIGGKRGLTQIEMLISLLYPWLSVTEVSSGELAEGLM